MSRHTGDDAPVTLRRATRADAARLADLYLGARHAAVPAVPPLVHLDAEVRQWFRNVVVPERETWLAQSAGHPLAVMVLDGHELDQLYVHPQWTGHGVGSALVRLAQSRRPERLTLWTFQSNSGAQRFYERHGFVAVQHTDGSGNEEQSPDIRYVWVPAIK